VSSVSILAARFLLFSFVFVKAGARPRKAPFLLFSFSFSLGRRKKTELKEKTKKPGSKKTAPEKKEPKASHVAYASVLLVKCGV
jgi:hypothetical protein